jgi:hypothetical protein
MDFGIGIAEVCKLSLHSSYKVPMQATRASSSCPTIAKSVYKCVSVSESDGPGPVIVYHPHVPSYSPPGAHGPQMLLQKVTQRLINRIFQDRHHTDPTLRATLRTPSRRCKRNRPKKGRTMDSGHENRRITWLWPGVYSHCCRTTPANGRHGFRERQHAGDARNVHVVTMTIRRDFSLGKKRTTRMRLERFLRSELTYGYYQVR